MNRSGIERLLHALFGERIAVALTRLLNVDLVDWQANINVRDKAKDNMQINTFSLKFLDVIVITDPKVANGSKETNGLFRDEVKILVGYDNPMTGRDANNDETRVNAKYVVVQAGMAGDVHAYGGPDSTWFEAVVSRLNDDGSFNPKSELLILRSNGYGPSIYAVDKVGAMTLVAVP